MKGVLQLRHFYPPANDGMDGVWRHCLGCGVVLECLDPRTRIKSLRHIYCPECLLAEKGRWKELWKQWKKIEEDQVMGLFSELQALPGRRAIAERILQDLGRS